MIDTRIHGVPYSRNKVRGNLGGPVAWTTAIFDQTQSLPKIQGACALELVFYLLRANVPTDCPFGNDLDNLLKRFFDALNETIFSDAPGHDSCVVKVTASKIIVDRIEEAGAHLKVAVA